MAGQNDINTNQPKLSRLQGELPAGLLATTDWLKSRGYYRQLLSHYVSSGWLESPARGVYRRPGSPLKWQQVVLSLQRLLKNRIHVGGRTALVHRGLGHYVQMSGPETILLFGAHHPVAWVGRLEMPIHFEWRSDAMFDALLESGGQQKAVQGEGQSLQPAEMEAQGLNQMTWGDGDWKLLYSSEERAILEVLQDVPERESVYEAHVLMQGLVNLRPSRLMALLQACSSIKVKRLFFALAERHGHAWFKHLGHEKVDFGKGNRMLVRGGKLHPKYRITLPADLDDHAR